MERTLLRIPLGVLYMVLLGLHAYAVARFTHSVWAGVGTASGLAVLVVALHSHWRALEYAIRQGFANTTARR